MNDLPKVDNLWRFIAPSLQKNHHRVAWICREANKNKRKIDYGQLEKAALTTAAMLRLDGIKQGDTVAVTAPNGPEWCVAALAVWKLGAKLAPIHIANSPSEMAAQIAAIKPRVMLGYMAPQLMDKQHLISLEFAMAAVVAERAMPVPSDANAVALSIYTSGSTGTPKIVKLSHQNMGANVYQALDQLQIDASDRFISLLPLSHAMGITATMLFPLFMGATIVVPRAIAAAEILATISEENITFMVAVPRLFRNIMLGLDKKFNAAGKGLRLYRRLLENMPLKMRTKLNAPIRKKLGGNIRCWLSGGAHLDGKITEFYHKLGIPLRQGYGLTETAPLLCVQKEFATARDSVGHAVKWAEIKIANPDEQGRGEVLARGANLMLGYEDAKQTADVMVDGWFKTGDLGRIDSQGQLTLTGRSKRLIVTDAGKNVYPEELECGLERDFRLKEAGVFAQEMQAVAVLAMHRGQSIEAARAVLKNFNDSVSSPNRINRFAVVDELPRTPLGKVALQQLPEVFAEFEVKGAMNSRRRC